MNRPTPSRPRARAGRSDGVLAELADVVGKLVPELQERGACRTAYEGSTLREHLALPALPPEA
jgi:hypothetical protein